MPENGPGSSPQDIFHFSSGSTYELCRPERGTSSGSASEPDRPEPGMLLLLHENVRQGCLRTSVRLLENVRQVCGVTGTLCPRTGRVRPHNMFIYFSSGSTSELCRPEPGTSSGSASEPDRPEPGMLSSCLFFFLDFLASQPPLYTSCCFVHDLVLLWREDNSNLHWLQLWWLVEDYFSSGSTSELCRPEPGTSSGSASEPDRPEPGMLSSWGVVLVAWREDHSNFY